MKFSPMQIAHLDLSKDLPAPESDGLPMLAVLWWRDLPLGMLAATAEETPFSKATLNAHLSRLVAEQRAARDPQLGAPLRGTYDGRPENILRVADANRANGTLAWLETTSSLPLSSAADLSVIICTRDRGPHLRTCLDSLAAQHSPPGEIVVVDNSQGGDARGLCARRPGVRYVHEARPGLSMARNAGILAASRPVIAFTDDDVQPHPLWTSEVARVFADGEHGPDAMTGLVLPSRLDTPAQAFFQMRMGGFGSRFVPVLFDALLYENTRQQGVHVWHMGAGANMAFRREIFSRVGLFDSRLGAGASGCSEDSEMWYRIIATGGTCQYEPRAVVYHDHRDSWQALRSQMRAYQNGHVSALVAQADRFGDRGNLRRIFRQLPSYFLRELFESVQAHEPERRRVLAEEFRGWCSGLRYVVNRRWRGNSSGSVRHDPQA
jgi:glycosyltransferase involved in cell wall biosynthesis